ncbi:MAG: asparagine synthase [Burkholderiales bacterium]|nr:asparagine synthase [Burkholderiales bacterium]
MNETLLLPAGYPGTAADAPLEAQRAAVLAELERGGPQSAAAKATGAFTIALRLPGNGCFLAVDRFAEHTLCYRVHDGQLQFAEQANAWADAGAGAELDLQALYDYLWFHCIPSPRTVWKGVFRLPPGHCALFRDGQLSVTPYWRPRFDEPRRPRFDELKSEFISTLESAVKQRLDGSKPACFLSGGTDSSTVAGMIGRVAGQPAATYSIGFEAQGYDEMAFARIAARHFGTEHHEYYVTPDDLVRSIADVAGWYDQPFGNSSALPAYYCARMACEQGVTRLLAGDGGDELFGGNARYAMQKVFGWYGALPQPLRSGLLEPVFGRQVMRAVPGLRQLNGFIHQARVGMPDRLQMYNLLRRLGAAEVLTPGFLAATDAADVLRQQREVWALAEAQTELNRTLAYDWRYTLAESDLPKVRMTARLAGMEVAFPMLDHALLELSLRVPTDYKLKGFRLRWFFKEALRGFLPDEILTKKKQGFGLPFGVWATRHEPLHRLAEESVRGTVDRGIVRSEFVDALFSTLLPSAPGYYGEMVWILMMLEQWLRRHAPQWRLPR